MSNESCDTLQVMRGNEKKTNKEWDIQGKGERREPAAGTANVTVGYIEGGRP